MNDSRTARDPVRIKKCTPRLEDIFAQGFDRALLETTRFGVEPNQIRPVESEPTKPRSVYSTGEIRPLESERNETCSGSVPESSRVQSESESEAPREATKAPPRRAPASLLHCTDLISSPSPARPPREGCTLRALAPRRVEGRAGSVGDGGRARGRRRRAPRVRAASVRRGGGARAARHPAVPPTTLGPPSYASSSHASSSSSRARARGPAASAPPSVPSSLPASDDALALAVEAACDGMDARAALRWVRLERDAYAALAAYHERRAAERDTHTRQRLRALGMWRLMGKLGLDVETSERSRVMVLAWLRACRDRLRASSSLDGRAPPERASRGAEAKPLPIELGRRRARPAAVARPGTGDPRAPLGRDPNPTRSRPEEATRREGVAGVVRRRQLVVVGIPIPIPIPLSPLPPLFAAVLRRRLRRLRRRRRRRRE